MAMNLATIQHHSYMKSAVVDVGVQVLSPLAPVTEYVAPASVPPVYTTTAVATGDNSDMFCLVYPQISSTAAEPVAPRVVVSLPTVEEFSAPVYDQVHQELVASSEMTENFVEIPVVHEQVIVQGIPEVIVPLPPAQEFSAPVYGQVHQVIVGMRPERLVDSRGPQRCDRTVPSVGAPVLAVQSLRGFDGVDDTTAKFLLQQALKMKEKEEEEQVKRQEDQEEALLTRLQAERDALLVLGLGALSSQQKKRLNAVLDEREAILDRRERRRVVAKRKRKKRRKKKTPKTSSSRGRARRRQRQWHTLYAGERGVVLLHAVFPSIVDRPEMLCIMAGMVQKDRCSGLYMAGITMLLALCSFPWLAGPECSAFWPVWTRRTVARGVQAIGFFWEMTSMSFCIQRSAWFESGYMHCVSLRCL